MRVLHILPSAFDYYNDLKLKIFSQIESERLLGIQSEAYTIQFGNVSKKEKNFISKNISTLSYNGLYDSKFIFSELDKYDIVHLHLPMFGFLKKLVDWKKNKPDNVLVVSVWIPPKLSDLFSYFVYIYSGIFDSKILALANAILCEDQSRFIQISTGCKLKKDCRIYNLSDLLKDLIDSHIHLTNNINSLKLNEADRIALANEFVYNNLYNFKKYYGKKENIGNI